MDEQSPSAVAFQQWLDDELGSLGITDQVYGEYILGMMNDYTSNDEEKIAFVIDFLSGATEKPLDAFTKNIVCQWNLHKESMSVDKEQEQPSKNAFSLAKAKLGPSSPRGNGFHERDKEQSPQLSREEKQKRQALLMKYSYDVVETDENGDIVFTDNNDDDEGVVDRGIFVNSNAKDVAEKQSAQREAAKRTHENLKLREKELLEREKAKKEKKKTVKKEHRRGPG